MMGLLDGLNSDGGMLGLYLMAAGAAKPQRTSLGEGLLGGMQMLQQRRSAREEAEAKKQEREQRAAMLQLQMQQIQRQQAEQEAAKATALAAQQRRASYLDSINPDAGPARPLNPAAALQAGLTTNEMGLFAPPKAEGPTILSQGQVAFGSDGKPLFSVPAAPKERAPTELARLLAEMEALPPNSPMRAIYEQQIRKISTHQPGVSVSYGAPFAAMDAGGNPVFAQPNKTGGPPSIIPGIRPPITAVEMKKEEDAAKAEERRQLSLKTAGNVIDTIGEAKKLVGVLTAGPVGAVAKNVPGTVARDLAAKIETIKANLGFDRLQQMRDASPTGGALGQVAIQELVALQSTIASLDQLQSPAALEKALIKADTHYNNWAATLRGGAQAQPQTTNTPAAGGEGRVRRYNPATGRIE